MDARQSWDSLAAVGGRLSYGSVPKLNNVAQATALANDERNMVSSCI